MHHILFGSDLDKLEVALLIKDTGFNKPKLEASYITPGSVPAEKFVAFDLAYQTPKKCTAAYAKSYLAELLPEIDALDIETLLVCDAIYFKYLTKNQKTDAHYGYICPCVIEGYEHMNVILAPNFQALLYNPTLQNKMDMALGALDKHLTGRYQAPGTNVIHKEYYPESVKDIFSWFNKLRQYDRLTCDIEGLSLSFWECGISTITFCWNKHEGMALAVDRGKYPKETRKLLKAFLHTYKGKLIYHNASFDMKVLVYELWMEHLADYKGMLDGICTLTESFEDTKLVAYMATNNAVQNVLSLKLLSAEFTGNYAQADIKDTSKIPLPDLLRYNLTDGLATWYVLEKYWPIMVRDQQLDLYQDLMKPTVKSLLQMELCGMPINPEKVQAAKKKLTVLKEGYEKVFENSQIIQDFNRERLIKKAEAFTAKAKKKIYTIDDPVIKEDFNPNSDVQLQELLYRFLGFPVIDKTKGKQPATGGKTLKKLINHTTDPDHKIILENLIGLGEVSIILTTFIVAFERAQQLPDGSWRLYGNFNLGGTQSLRLSSSNPNLQNLPSHSTFAKIVKECFEPIDGWLFIGSDFDSLEDKINALLTRDPQKEKVYTDGFDGHSLRALSYFQDQITGIDEDDANSVNSLAKLYPDQRQASKAPTFALTYGGTFLTLMNNCGFSEEQAKTIEARYHELYAVADQWTADLIEDAKKIGYVPMAFGGRIRTPLLAMTVGFGRVVPFQAQKEARSAGNAATQSYCVLTLRALNEFMERVWASPYKYLILPAATIHDADYFMVADSAEVVCWLNENLIDCMAWQELPEIQHPTIKLTSGLEIYWPNWAHKVSVPNGVSRQELKQICRKATT